MSYFLAYLIPFTSNTNRNWELEPIVLKFRSRWEKPFIKYRNLWLARSLVREALKNKIRNLTIAAGTFPYESKNNVTEVSLQLWQEKWQIAAHDRITEKYFPDVRKWYAYRYVKPEHYAMQFLTGHGDLDSWLFLRGIITSERLCACGSEETMQHLLTVCSEFENQRAALMSVLEGEQRG